MASRCSEGALGEVRALQTEIEQIFSNLIGNAVKYLGTPAEPAIQIGRIDRDGAVEYFVRDNGIGIAPAYHAKVFEPFQRLKDVEAEGTGRRPGDRQEDRGERRRTDPDRVGRGRGLDVLLHLAAANLDANS